MPKILIGDVVGPAGANGIGIKNITFKEEQADGNVYTITLTNDSTHDIKAPKGPQGPTGAKGEDGQAGATGPQGVSIESITFKNTNEDGGNVYTITLTNQNTYEFTAPRGQQGIPGQQGPAGSTDFNNLDNKPDLSIYAIKTEVDEKFKNFCPFKVGDIYLTTNSTNPSSVFLGTTWQKIEGRFLFGTSGSGASKQTGGSNSKTIAQANLPAVKIQLDSFSLSRGTMDITGSLKNLAHSANTLSSATGAFTKIAGTDSSYGSSGGGAADAFDFKASKTWTGSTNSVSPQTSALGNGQALDITPSYYTCHMWLRLT